MLKEVGYVDALFILYPHLHFLYSSIMRIDLHSNTEIVDLNRHLYWAAYFQISFSSRRGGYASNIYYDHTSYHR